VNLPNYLTLSRIASVPLLIFLLSPKLPWFAEKLHAPWLSAQGNPEIFAVTLFILASITDGIDGYLARRRGQVTTLGMLLDPLADKLMVAGAFIALVQFNPSVVPAWIAVLVISREFLVSGLRSIAASEGFTIEASDLGKFKMVVQIVAIVAAILQHQWEYLDVPLTGAVLSRPIYLHVELIARTAMWFMVTISLISAFDYFAGFWRKIDRSAVRTRRRPFVLSRRKRALQAKQDAAADNASQL
jgi:CDP-diacylglycerol--glycerol-3-phosphate 3-phosphatidyltransferase